MLKGPEGQYAIMWLLVFSGPVGVGFGALAV
jgi:hypothetical protein